VRGGWAAVRSTTAADKLALIFYTMMEYMKRDEEAYVAEVCVRLKKQFHRRLEELGYGVMEIEAEEEVPESKFRREGCLQTS
jgi:glutamate/tyrosine decarboxylase-like PLP-dependent enzyme